MDKAGLFKKYLMRVRNREIVKCHMGGDPEFFVASKENGDILNSDRFFPGKDAPSLVKSSTGSEIGKLYFDGIQAEIGFRPNTCREEMCVDLRILLNQAMHMIDNNKILLKPSVRVKKAIIDKAHPEARIFGCMPDFNAYTLGTNTCEMDASTHFYRYAGGHIHLGKSSPYLKTGDPECQIVENQENHIRVVRLLDLILGVPTLALDNQAGSALRRSKYGKAGCFRPTPYGIEYRTPSCWWLQSPATTSLVMGLARLAWNLLIRDADMVLRDIAEAYDEEVRGIVDEGDVKSANKLWKRMRAAIALTGTMRNPLNIGNTITSQDWHRQIDIYNQLDKVMDEFLRRSENGGVSALASLEYISKYGINQIVSPDIEQAWSVSRGFLSTSIKELAGNSDFQKFQTSFAKELSKEVEQYA